MERAGTPSENSHSRSSSHSSADPIKSESREEMAVNSRSIPTEEPLKTTMAEAATPSANQSNTPTPAASPDPSFSEGSSGSLETGDGGTDGPDAGDGTPPSSRNHPRVAEEVSDGTGKDSLAKDEVAGGSISGRSLQNSLKKTDETNAERESGARSAGGIPETETAAATSSPPERPENGSKDVSAPAFRSLEASQSREDAKSGSVLQGEVLVSAEPGGKMSTSLPAMVNPRLEAKFQTVRSKSDAAVELEDDETDEHSVPSGENIIVERSPGGRYVRFLEKLGSGASKDVYRAYDTQEGIEVAWNVVTLSGVPKTERNRIVNEVRLLERLHHHNIISFHGSWVNRERQEVNFVTEILSSGTLKSFINKVQVIRWKIAKRWAVQILKGLEYLHGQDPPVIHRDLKCDNIFINGTSGDLRIGDLGLSTVHRNGRVLSVLGTPEFMAPDMYEEKSYDEKVDIYAFGMCLLEIFTKELPYKECRNAAQIYKKVSRGELPSSLARIKSHHAREFIMLCLGRQDENGRYIRPTASELLKHEFLLKRANDEDEVEVDPPMMERAISETSSLPPSPTGSASARVTIDFPIAQPSLQVPGVSDSAPAGHSPARKERETEEDESDRFEEMPDSEVNIGKVKVYMGRGKELKEEEEQVTLLKGNDETPLKLELNTPGGTTVIDPPQPSMQYLVAAAVIEDGNADPAQLENDMLKLVVTLPVEGQTQNVQFEFHLVEDDPVQVAKEMVSELGIPQAAVLEISETISGLACAARMDRGRARARSQNNAVPNQPPQLQQSSGNSQPLQQERQQAVGGFTGQANLPAPQQAHSIPGIVHGIPPLHNQQPPGMGGLQEQPHFQVHQHLAQPPTSVDSQSYTSSTDVPAPPAPSGFGQVQMPTQIILPQNAGNAQPVAAQGTQVQHLRGQHLPHQHQHQHQPVAQINERNPTHSKLQGQSNGHQPMPSLPQAAPPQKHVPSLSQPQDNQNQIHHIQASSQQPQNQNPVQQGQPTSQQQPHSIQSQQAPNGPQHQQVQQMTQNQVQHAHPTPQQPVQNQPVQQATQNPVQHAHQSTQQQQQQQQQQQPIQSQHAHQSSQQQQQPIQSQHAQNGPQQQQIPQNQLQHAQHSSHQQPIQNQQAQNSAQQQQMQQNLHVQHGGHPPKQQQQQPVLQGSQQMLPGALQPQIQQQQSQDQHPQTSAHPQQNHMNQATTLSGTPHSQPQLAHHQQVQPAVQPPVAQLPHLQPLDSTQVPQDQRVHQGVQLPQDQTVQPSSNLEGHESHPQNANTTSVGHPGASLQPRHQTGASQQAVPGTAEAVPPGIGIQPLDESPDSCTPSEENLFTLSDDDVDDDALNDEEIRKLSEEFEKNMMRAKRVFDNRMDNLARSQSEREAQHQKTLEKHEKERLEFEKRLRQEAKEQKRRMEQLRLDFNRRKEDLAKNKQADAHRRKQHSDLSGIAESSNVTGSHSLSSSPRDESGYLAPSASSDNSKLSATTYESKVGTSSGVGVER